VKEFQRERNRLDDLDARLKGLKNELENAPSDFVYPATQPSLAELLSRPALIDSALSETLAEDVEALFTEHEPTTRLGNFHPLMAAARSLLAEPKNALGRLAGQVMTVENAATGYRQELLESYELRSVQKAYSALLQAKIKPTEKPLDMADLKQAASLKAAKALVETRCSAWPAQGEELLAETGVDFSAWSGLVTALEKRQKPGLSGKQIQSLVDHGVIEVTYRLGGGE